MRALWFTLAFTILLSAPSITHALPEYAERTGFACQICHAEPAGGELTRAGKEFREELKIKGLYRPLNPFQRVVRLIIGYLHLLTAIAWFGTIIYVHVLLKPAYAAKGLPKGELILGWLGIVILTLTGILLTIARVPTWNVFLTTRFGILLGIKIILFAIMVTTAFIVTFVIGPIIRKGQNHRATLPKGRMSPEDLLQFDGTEGKPAYFAYQGNVYDVTASKLWKDGTHLRKHRAGADLTESLKAAPHGHEKIFQVPRVGELVPVPSRSQRPRHERVFYFMAYMNLVFVLLITFTIALWRWW